MEDELKEIKQLALNNAKEIKANADRIDKNFANIRNNSYALEFIKDYKADSKRWFTILIVVLCMWFITIGYLVYVLNDIGTIETIQEVENVETIGGSVVNDGDING